MTVTHGNPIIFLYLFFISKKFFFLSFFTFFFVTFQIFIVDMFFTNKIGCFNNEHLWYISTIWKRTYFVHKKGLFILFERYFVRTFGHEQFYKRHKSILAQIHQLGTNTRGIQLEGFILWPVDHTTTLVFFVPDFSPGDSFRLFVDKDYMNIIV